MKLFLSILLLTVVGCHSGWDKDPLADKSHNVKNAQPGGPEKPIPPLKDVVFIDADEFYDFKVGQEKVITFNYRVTHPDLSAIELEIPGLEDALPGASFNNVENKLTWTPPENFVVGAQYIRRLPISLVLYVDNKGTIEEHRKKVAINVLRNNLEAPTIVEVRSLGNRLKENRSNRFRVIVKDVHSSDQERPSLSVVSTSTGQSDGSGLVHNVDSTPSQDFSDATLWHFNMIVDLRDKELTDSSQTKSFGLRAVSAMGVPSTARKENLRVLTQIVRPDFFMQDTVFYKGQENSYSFSIVDPKSEGEIVVDRSWEETCNNFVPPAKCSCKSSNSQALCNIRWKPTALGQKNLRIKATNTINIQFVQDRVSKSSSFKIDVKEQ